MSDLIIELNQQRNRLRKTIDLFQQAGQELAEAECGYKKEQSKMIILLNQTGYENEYGKTKPIAITACQTLSQGLEPVASMRLQRDIKLYNYEGLKELIYSIKREITILERMIWGELKGV